MPYPGSQFEVTITCTDETAVPPALKDPTTLTVQWGYRRQSDGTEQGVTTTAWPSGSTITRDSTGKFHLFVTSPEAGVYGLAVTAVGALAAANATSWTVSPNPDPLG